MIEGPPHAKSLRAYGCPRNQHFWVDCIRRTEQTHRRIPKSFREERCRANSFGSLFLFVNRESAFGMNNKFDIMWIGDVSLLKRRKTPAQIRVHRACSLLLPDYQIIFCRMIWRPSRTNSLGAFSLLSHQLFWGGWVCYQWITFSDPKERRKCRCT